MQENLEKSTQMLDSILCTQGGAEEQFVDSLPEMVGAEDLQIEPDVTIEPVPVPEGGKTKLEPLIRVRSASALQITSSPPLIKSERLSPPPPPLLLLNSGPQQLLSDPVDALEPTDLSNKKPENLTCVPEIDFIKEEINDAASDYSNSSDPDRLEVDMSQVIINSILCRQS